MTKALSRAELKTLKTTFPASRSDRLERWADVIDSAGDTIYIFHGLENYSSDQKMSVGHPGSAFALAYNDPVLHEAGLPGPTVGEAQAFFELTDAELHAFSCDCGGYISNKEMAARVRAIARSGAGEASKALPVSGALIGLACGTVCSAAGVAAGYISAGLFL